jgi:hypothetical protein
MRVKLFLCSDSSAIDIRTNSASAFHILEEAMGMGLPFVIPRISIITIIERDDNEPNVANMTLRLSLNERQIFENPIELTFQGRNVARTIVDVHNIVIPVPGDLLVALNYEGTEMARWAIKIIRFALPGVEVHPIGEPQPNGPPVQAETEPAVEDHAEAH